jgi:hypothetical protein
LKIAIDIVDLPRKNMVMLPYVGIPEGMNMFLFIVYNQLKNNGY